MEDFITEDEMEKLYTKTQSKTENIYMERRKNKDDDGYFEVDSSISDSIINFNLKGYKTIHSCGGHYYVPKDDIDRDVWYLLYDMPYLVIELSNDDPEYNHKVISSISSVIASKKLDLDFMYSKLDIADSDEPSKLIRVLDIRADYNYYRDEDIFWKKNNIKELCRGTKEQIKAFKEVFDEITIKFRSELFYLSNFIDQIN